MIIPFNTLWKFSAVVASSALCALLYLKMLRPPDPATGHAPINGPINALRSQPGDEARPKHEAVAPPTMTVQAGDTFVLPRATPVRLKYGSTILPAGLSLRVLARAQNSLTVEYSGETVVVPWP